MLKLNQEGTRVSNLQPTENGEEQMNQQTMFLVHLKEHGITYAVVVLVAQQLGLLDQLLGLAGGMC